MPSLKLTLALLLLPLVGFASEADRAFERRFGDGFFDAFWAQNPGFGIGVGYYKYADRLIVPDAKERTKELKFIERWQSYLRAIPRTQLNANNQADWTILDSEFSARRWEINEARAWEWNPSVYNVAEPIAKILSTDFAPLPERLRTIGKRLKRVPAYYAAAKQNIKAPTREHTQLGIDQNKGALAVFEGELPEKIESSALSAAEKAMLIRDVDAARGAINDYVSWLQALEGRLAKEGATSFRLGAERYEQKFGYSIQTGVGARELYERALREREQLHNRMTVLTDQLWPKYFPNTAPPDDRLERIGRLIDQLSEEHVPRDQFQAEIERQIPELARWVETHGLLTLDADKPLRVRTTPAHQRGVAMASIDAPGPYDALAPTYYNVAPLEGLPADRAESLLREYNRWMLPILNIHEAIPGHYAQLVYANKAPSRIKAIFGNGAMVEGWAVYGERMMLESGYGNHAAEIWLIYSKWLLRSVSNTILDYGVHVLGMTEAQAQQLLVTQAFQSAEEASAKWRRVQLTSVQLCSYFAGYSAIYDLRERQKRTLGVGFNLKKFHERFLSFGNAPVSVIEDLMATSP
jgi:hypothetical protein